MAMLLMMMLNVVVLILSKIVILLLSRIVILLIRHIALVLRRVESQGHTRLWCLSISFLRPRPRLSIGFVVWHSMCKLLVMVSMSNMHLSSIPIQHKKIKIWLKHFIKHLEYIIYNFDSLYYLCFLSLWIYQLFCFTPPKIFLRILVPIKFSITTPTLSQLLFSLCIFFNEMCRIL